MRSVRWAVLILALVGAATGVAQADPESTFSQILRPGLTLEVEKGCGKTYRYGEYLEIKVRSDRAGYLTIFHFSADKNVQILFPNQYHADNRIEANRDYTIPGAWFPFRLRISEPAGKELLFGVVTERQHKLVPDDYVDFTRVFPALKLDWGRSAGFISYGVSIIPGGMWWAAAMCVFYVETEPPPPPPPPTTWGMSGRVTTTGGTGIPDVTITFTRVSGSGAVPASVKTDANGYWSQRGFEAGTVYRATPSKSGCTFTPAYHDRSNASTDVNFTGTCPTVTPPPPPPPPPATGWALFVGISDYVVEEVVVDGMRYRFKDLTAPASDARAMASVLKDLFPNQRVLTDKDATYDAIKRGFTEWLSQAPADATVLFYFSGHGGQRKDTDGDETEDGRDETLVSTDGKMILDDEVNAWVKALRASRVVIISDSCHSGTIHRGVRTFTVTESRLVPPWLIDGFGADFLREGQRAPGKVVALSACRPHESAWEMGALGHGVFTYCLLEGLKGKADKDRDKTITAQELFAYARDCVPGWVSLITLPDGTRPTQIPQLHDGLVQPVPLARLQ